MRFLKVFFTFLVTRGKPKIVIVNRGMTRIYHNESMYDEERQSWLSKCDFVQFQFPFKRLKSCLSLINEDAREVVRGLITINAINSIEVRQNAISIEIKKYHDFDSVEPMILEIIKNGFSWKMRNDVKVVVSSNGFYILRKLCGVINT